MDEEPDVPEVRPPTIDDIRRICRALDEAGAHYVLIGGFAVILHGGLRTTKDIDLLVDPDPANVEHLKRALAVLEDDAAREIEAGDLQRYTVVRVADEVLVDLLAAACGVTWLEGRARRCGSGKAAGGRPAAPVLLSSRIALAAASAPPVQAQNFLMNSAETINRGNFKIAGYRGRRLLSGRGLPRRAPHRWQHADVSRSASDVPSTRRVRKRAA